MIIIDAQLSPKLAVWITEKFGFESCSAKFLGFETSNDKTIFDFAKSKNATVITKDDDFVRLSNTYGSPPKVIWLTCGNTSKTRVKEILEIHLLQALELLKGSDLIEISGI
jgi:predicted nuclease of predicted toxin-antitoxin system